MRSLRAVRELEKAVELKPGDPTINDHLGDAYWKTGRTLEATFQWAHARDLNPEPDDLKKITGVGPSLERKLRDPRERVPLRWIEIVNDVIRRREMRRA